MENKASTLNKWRLILGKYAEKQLSFEGQDTQYMNMDLLLDYLYNREYSEEDGVRKRGASLDASNLTVPEWITKIRELFPKETVEILEKHALDRYQMTELIQDKEVLEKLEPNQALLKTILQMKHLMKGEVLEAAKKIVAKVAKELTEKLESNIKKAITGRIDKNKSSLIKSARNIDFKKTIEKNLKNYNIETKKIVLDQVYFNARVRRYHTFRIIIAVDESGSMLDSVIHSAIMAGIFAKLPMLDTKLIIFDTQVVDLSGYVEDPVETLMSVQLGGGTNISRALEYCETLIENPHKTIVVLVTDLYEGGGYSNLYARTKTMIESGAKLIVLTSLDLEATPCYDKNAAKQMVELGAKVAAMTPEHLAEWIGESMK